MSLCFFFLFYRIELNGFDLRKNTEDKIKGKLDEINNESVAPFHGALSKFYLKNRSRIISPITYVRTRHEWQLELRIT